jgi:putative endonuclease
LADHNEIGIKGEKLAASYLLKKGYRIINSNWRHRHKEVDIIARDGDELVIIEVKLRSTDYFGDPSEAVTRKKQRFLIEAAEAYLESIADEPEVRFDIVSIIVTSKGYDFEHIIDAFCP